MRPLKRRKIRQLRKIRSRRSPLCQLTIQTGTAALLALSSQALLHKSLGQTTPDPHWLAVMPDEDGDFLTDIEEAQLGLLGDNPDQNHNLIPDGVELAKLCAVTIDALPVYSTGAVPDTIHIVHHQMRGLESCEICGESVNMGYLEVINPRINQPIEIPYISLHYLNHGSFSYDGTLHDGRLNVPQFIQLLELSFPDSHQLMVPVDGDLDLLADTEEKKLGTDPGDSDQNDNGMPDGVELAIQCAVKIDQLPRYTDAVGSDAIYVIEHYTFGLETCEICGKIENMGFMEVVNADKALAIAVPFISQHFMHHGSFTSDGTEHDLRLDVPLLLKVLELGFPDRHQVPVANDSDGDLLSDPEEHGLGYLPFEADMNSSGTLDGVDLARALHVRITDLINSGGADHIQIFRHELDGLEECLICGEWIHMGGTEMTNTALKLRYPEGIGFLPDIALHAMAHGSLTYLGDDHQGRAEVLRLMRVLEMTLPYEPDEHDLPPAGSDTDFDRLTDLEEIKALSNLYDPDQNLNLIPDGVETARRCSGVIDELPRYDASDVIPDAMKETYVIDHPMKGLENCLICGLQVNMGYLEIVNPGQGTSMEVPYIAKHYLEHGCFEFAGDVHGRGRAMVNPLLQILEFPRQCGDLGTVYLPADSNRNCVIDMNDLAGLTRQWLSDTQP